LNPNKKVVIPFTRTRSLKRLEEPSLFNKMIQITSKIKYFGITLAKGLIWKKQIDIAINKAYRAFWTCRSMPGKTWQLKPRVVY
jgi:hypothetical protein